MSQRIAEKKLFRPVQRFLEGRGCLRSYTELRFLDRGIDIYAVSAREGCSYAIELKIFDWRKALRQAAIYQLCADFCYVAMPAERAAKLNVEAFRSAGVGLLGVNVADRAVTEILRPEVSPVKNNFYSGSFQRSFKSSVARKADGARKT